MFFNSAKKEGEPVHESDQINKILLLLFGVLILLIFMDVQARKHYGNISATSTFNKEKREYRKRGGKVYKKYRRASENRLKKLNRHLTIPIKKTANEIFGIPDSDLVKNTSAIVPIKRYRRNNVYPFSEGKPLNRSLYLYFIRFRGGRSELVRVKRRVDFQNYTPIRILKLLQKGPNPNERGLLSAFNQNTGIHSLRIKNGIAFLTMDNTFFRNRPRIITDRLHQIILTLTQFKEIKDVKFIADGHTVKRIGSVKITYPKRRRIVNYRR